MNRIGCIWQLCLGFALWLGIGAIVVATITWAKAADAPAQPQQQPCTAQTLHYDFPVPEAAVIDALIRGGDPGYREMQTLAADFAKQTQEQCAKQAPKK